MNGKRKSSVSVMEMMRAEITKEQYPEGFRIGSIRSLARNYGVSSRTVAKAVALLVDEGILRTEARQGIFLKSSPQIQPVIGYAGVVLNPQSNEKLLDNAISGLYDVLLASGCKTSIITHRELTNHRSAAAKLKELDALLLSANFLDPVIEPLIFDLHIPLILFGANFIIEKFSGSQVVPDLQPALKTFHEHFPLERYRRLLVVKPPHPNADALFHQISVFLEWLGLKDRVELFAYPGPGGCYSAELAAYKYFVNLKKTDMKDTLVMSLSDYCSIGIYEAGKANGWFPEVLSFDNLESLMPQMVASDPYFTSVDWKIAQCYKSAAELAVKLAKEKVQQNYIIRIPAEVVFRQSVHP